MVIGILASFFLASGGADGDIAGIWMTQKQDSKIEISKSPDGTYTGKIIWAEAPHESFVGTVVMKGVKYDPGKGDYICPWIYDPRINVTAHAYITLNDSVMKVKACKGFITKQEMFVRERSAEDNR